MTGDGQAGEHRFWQLAQPLLDRPGVSRSTMMGFPCLRLGGDFFASCDRRDGSLVVKLDEALVESLLASGRAEPFAPSGRRFREWAAVPYGRRRSWARHLDAAFDAAVERSERRV